jgi:hypothetical protein
MRHRPNPNPELKMTPSQTKLMEQCRKEACDWVLAEVTKNLGYTPDETLAEFVVERNGPALHAYAQALFDERSKRPTVEQVEKEIAAGSHRPIDSGDGYEWMVINVQDLRSRLTKLFGGG